MPSYWDANGNLVDGRYEITGRTTKTIQTHNAVSVGPTNGQSFGAWFDCTGFYELSVTAIISASKSGKIYVHWSNDGSIQHGGESSATFTSSANPTPNYKIKAKWARIVLENSDAASQTMSGWAYLTT